MRAVLKSMGIESTAITDLSQVSNGKFDVVIIGKDQLIDAAGGAGQEELTGFVRDGGRVIVMEQSKFPSDFLGLRLETRNTGATITFNVAPNHPITQGLTPDDLKFWRGDNIVSGVSLIKPSRGNVKTLIEAGTGQGLNLSNLFTLRLGRGVVVFNQMELTNKCGREPAAGILARNILGYCAGFEPADLRAVGVLAGGSSRMPAFLDKIGVVSKNLPDKLGESKLDDFSCLIVDGSNRPAMEELAAYKGVLRSYVDQGGALIVHQLQLGDEGLVASLTGTALAPAQPAADFHASTRLRDPILDGISNYDLYYGRYDNYQLSSARRILGPAWTIKSGAGTSLLDPDALLSIPLGKGRVIIDGVLWDGS